LISVKISLDDLQVVALSVLAQQSRRMPVPSLRIPERYRDGIIKLAEISEDGFNQLRAALAGAPECKDVKELSAWVGTETPALSDAERVAILRALAPMFRVQRNAGVTPTRFASDILTSLLEEVPARMESVSADTLKARISQLIETNSLDLIGTKVDELRGEFEKTFCGARVLTDLRPVFKGSVEEDPGAMLLTHTLRLRYHEMGEHREFYVTMDADDLAKLQKSLARAKQKAATLASWVGRTGIKTE
jgi:hypothetical protein